MFIKVLVTILSAACALDIPSFVLSAFGNGRGAESADRFSE